VYKNDKYDASVVRISAMAACRSSVLSAGGSGWCGVVCAPVLGVCTEVELLGALLAESGPTGNAGFGDKDDTGRVSAESACASSGRIIACSGMVESSILCAGEQAGGDRMGDVTTGI
jgi:hypothetical protein